MSAQFQAAFVRAIGGAAIAALAIMGVALGANSDLTVAAKEAAASAIAYFVWRAAAEGWYDTNRNLAGNVKPSDVGGARLLSMARGRVAMLKPPEPEPSHWINKVEKRP